MILTLEPLKIQLCGTPVRSFQRAPGPGCVGLRFAPALRCAPGSPFPSLADASTQFIHDHTFTSQKFAGLFLLSLT
jgi:hypothetical protein